MTDKEKTIALFTELGIGFFIEVQGKNKEIEYIFCEYDNKNIKGLSWCHSYFEFDCNGKFVSMGAYER
jgi:hypothetical protein